MLLCFTIITQRLSQVAPDGCILTTHTSLSEAPRHGSLQKLPFFHDVTRDYTVVSPNSPL